MADSELQKKTAGRLAFIDWTRGLAALIMLQGHTFNSFTKQDLRSGGPYMLSQFAGGLPPAIFLFLTGITFAFLMDSQDRRGLAPGKRVWGALKRARYLFFIAFLFRLQMFVTGFPTSPARDILKVDILNCMGFAMLLFAPLAILNTLERVRWCVILGALIAGFAPVMTMLKNPVIPALISSYVFPDYNQFGLFPWAAFFAFGLAVGSVLRLVNGPQMQAALLWMFCVGAATAMCGLYLSNLPYSLYPKSEFWLDSPGLTVIKTGLVLCFLGLAYLWTNLAAGQRWSLFRQLGTTSLLVYWVHIELVYGRWFGFWKDAMTPLQVVAYTVGLTGFMTLLSMLQTRYKTIGSFFQPTQRLEPQPVPVD